VIESKIGDKKTMMESVIYSIGLIAMGFVPTLAVLELTWKMAYRLGKRDAFATAMASASNTA
jgi:uncharacterized membrane protein YfbV (UPF0208 family)